MPKGIFTRNPENEQRRLEALRSPEVRAKISAALTGREQAPEHRANHLKAMNNPEVKAKLSKAQAELVGENATAWKGDEAQPIAKHRWHNSYFGKPDHCEVCGLSDSTRKYAWCSINGHKYSRNRDDYKMMCYSCHVKFDFSTGARKPRQRLKVKCAHCRKAFFIPPSRLKGSQSGLVFCCKSHANTMNMRRRWTNM